VCLSREELRALLDGLEYATRQQNTSANDLTAAWAVLRSIRYIVPGCWRPNIQTGEGCVDYFPAAPAYFEFAPTNPHTSPDAIPDGYILPPFRVAASAVENIAGLRAGDVYTTILQAPFNALANGYPRVRINVPAGTRQLEIHLLSIPTGGYALLTLDDNPLSAQVVDLNKDVISVPPETFGEPIVEYEFTDSAPHYVWVTYLPRFNDEGAIITFGGGIRKITLCGGDMACCPEDTNTERATLEIAAAGARREINQAWNVAAPAAPAYIPATYDAGDNGGAVLCLALEGFMSSAFNTWAQNAAREGVLAAAAATALYALFPPLGVAAGLLLAAGMVYNQQRADAIADADAVKRARCCLYDGLRGQVTTHEALKNAANTCQNSLTGNAALVMSVMQDFFAARDNYRLFAESVAAAQGNAPTSDDDCVCCESIALETSAYSPLTVLTDMGDGIWRIEGGQQTDDPARPNLWVWAFAIAGGCCALVDQPSQQSGYPQFSVFDHYVVNCDGQPSGNVGGFTPGNYTLVVFRQEPAQAPFYVHVQG
jgi:hypothetical protein